MKIDKSKKFTEFFDLVIPARKIDFIVLHHIEASSAQSAIDMLLESKVSSHFLIEESGNIFQLVEEGDVAYHAGVSYWRGFDGLNKNSIGIEFINSSAFDKKFEAAQMQAGLELIRYLMEKYNIDKVNIVGHSDIAYDRATKLLDRKQDPSHFFDWKFLAQNGVAICPEVSLEKDEELFKIGDKSAKIKSIKENLAKFGYMVLNFNDEFDQEMQALARVFNRRFNQEKFKSDADVWCLSSDEILEKLASNS